MAEEKRVTLNESVEDEDGAIGGINIVEPNSNRRQSKQTNSLIPGVTDASPPKFVSWEEINVAAKGITNMALAHEIAVDEDFRLEKIEPSKNSIQSRVKDTLHKAFWDLLREDLRRSPPNYTQALVLLNDIKENLFSCLLAQHSRLKDEIDEVLDSDLIKQQVENNTLDFKFYADFVVSMISKLCAPIRDEKVKELKEETDTVNLFRKILEVLDLMKLDMANFTITMFRSDIKIKSVEYEKAQFKNFLQLQEDNGTDGLEFTKEWMFQHYSDDVKKSHWYKILGQCYMDLLEWDEERNYPETVLMDKTRFAEIGEECHKIAIVGAIVLMAVSVSNGALQAIPAAKDVIKNHAAALIKEKQLSELSGILEAVAEQVVKDTNEAVQKTPVENFAGEKQSILYHNILEVSSPTHRIRKLIYDRLIEFLLTVITVEPSKAAQMRIPPGLSSLQNELSAVAARLLRLVQHNREVFGEFYCDIFTAAAAATSSQEENGDESSTSRGSLDPSKSLQSQSQSSMEPKEQKEDTQSNRSQPLEDETKSETKDEGENEVKEETEEEEPK